MNEAWPRQSSAEWAARAVTDLCGRQLRAQSDAEFREAVAEAAALHAHDELFSKHIEREPAPEDPVDWAMAEASDDEDEPMPDAPPEPELIDTPPAPASARPMSNLERCIALSLCMALDRVDVSQRKCHLHHITSSLCCLTCPLSRVSCSLLSHVSSVPCVFVLCVLPRLPDSDKKVYFFFHDGLKKC